MRRAYVVLAALAALIAAALASSPFEFADPANVPDPFGGGGQDGGPAVGGENLPFIPTALAYYWASNPVLDESDVMWLSNYDLLILDRYRYDDVGGDTWAALRALNPDIKILLYVSRNVANWQDATAADERNTVARYEDALGHSIGAFSDQTDFYLLGAGDVRTHNPQWADNAAGDTMWVADPTAVQWADWYTEAVVADLAGRPWSADGIFMDNHSPTYGASWNVVPTETTEQEYADGINAEINVVNQAVEAEGLLLSANRIGTVDVIASESWFALDASASPPFAIMEEAGFITAWAPGNEAQFATMNQWRRMVNLLNNINNSRIIWFSHVDLAPGETGTDNGGDPVTYEEAKWFALASFLVGAQGGDDYFMFGEEAFVSGDQWQPEYDEIDLGAPADTNVIVPEGWQEWRYREFEHGWVLANPSNLALTITLPDTGQIMKWDNYTDISTEAIRDTFTMRSQRGYILIPHQNAVIVNDPTFTLTYGSVNGDEITASVDASSSEAVDWTLEATYTSQMRQVITPATDYYNYKTAANGVHSASAAAVSSVSGLSTTIGPRAYHGDHVRIVLTAAASDGRESSFVLHDGLLDYPIPTSPADMSQDGYTVAGHHSGGTQPEATGVPLSDWAKSDVLVVTNNWLWDDHRTSTAWENWAQGVRDEAGSQNKAIIGFTNLYYRVTGGAYPASERIWQYLWHLENTMGNAIQRDWEGNIPTHRYGLAGAVCPNLLNTAVMDSMARFIAQEWRYSENRLYHVGQMWDVYEHMADQSTAGWWDEDQDGIEDPGERSDNKPAIGVIDMDRDGVPWKYDTDEGLAIPQARLDWLDRMRTELVATGAAWGNSFILGANSVSARADSAMLERLDMIFMEDVHVPHTIGTGYETYPVDCYTGVLYMPYHRMFSDSFTRAFCSGIWYETSAITSGLLPRPSDMNSSALSFPSIMRTDAGGPYVFFEHAGTRNSSTGEISSIHPRYAEALSLMGDGLVPSWIRHGETYRRGWDHPSNEGFADLHAIGTAIEPMQREQSVTDPDYRYWHRTFTNGEAEILIKDQTVFDDQHVAGDATADTTEVDQFEYRVTVGGTVLRQSGGWFAPLGTPLVAVATSDMTARESANNASDWPTTRDTEITSVAWTMVTPATGDSTSHITDGEEIGLQADDTYNGAPEPYYPDHGMLWFDASGLGGRTISNCTLWMRSTYNQSLTLAAGDTLYARWSHAPNDNWYTHIGYFSDAHEASSSWVYQDNFDSGTGWSPGLSSRWDPTSFDCTVAYIAGPASFGTGEWIEIDVTEGLQEVVHNGAHNGGLQLWIIDHDTSTREFWEFEHFDGAVANQFPFFRIDYYDPAAVPTITSTTFADDIGGGQSYTATINRDGAATYEWRYRTASTTVADPCVDPVYFGPWSAWASRASDISMDPGIAEGSNVWVGIDLEVRTDGGTTATDSNCDSFQYPK